MRGAGRGGEGPRAPLRCAASRGYRPAALHGGRWARLGVGEAKGARARTRAAQERPPGYDVPPRRRTEGSEWGRARPGRAQEGRARGHGLRSPFVFRPKNSRRGAGTHPQEAQTGGEGRRGAGPGAQGRGLTMCRALRGARGHGPWGTRREGHRGGRGSGRPRPTRARAHATFRAPQGCHEGRARAQVARGCGGCARARFGRTRKVRRRGVTRGVTTT
jgi:hypothetical protein